ncbi:MAG: hypothetical protein PHZ25_03070 [Candidatus Pacebacteria bacterium]|nr:hypothetical protein [Candidatus Paceibacterota bacterium]
MKCKEINCSGEIDESVSVPMRIGCFSFDFGFACSVCGRIYWKDGTSVKNRQGNDCFLQGDEVVCKNKERVEISRFAVGS